MEEKHNPNTSPEHLRRQDTSSSWSELPQDLLILVFERLRLTTDFKRAKSVCSSWYSASRHYVPEKQTTPWLILFPEDENINNQNHNSCLLFNLEEKHKLYKTQDLGLDFTKSVCMTTYGNWLLMRDPQNDLYIVNLFTQERINLPPVKSQLGQTTIRSPVFWIDEETKDYVVVWARENTYVVYAKKGDTSWNRIPTISSCNDMVYKDHKLYVLSCSGNFTIFDFFGKIPEETVHCGNMKWIYDESWSVTRRKLVITLKGDVLVVERRICNKSCISFFHVYKIYSSRFFKRIREVDSFGTEAILFDLGITVPAKNIKGLKKSCIYFDASNERHTSVVQFFNLTTRRMEPLRKFDCSSIQLCSARWFLPSF